MPKINKTLRILLAVVVIIPFAVVWFGKTAYIPPILMYHSISVGKAKDSLHVSQQTFARQMEFLKNHRYHVIPLETLAVLIKEKKKIPPHTIAITFDDGRNDNYTLAFPVLKKYHMSAAIFIIVNEVGRADRLNWDEIKDMQQSGIITFGSHTLDHLYLVDVTSDEILKRQIFDSKAALEARLRQPVTTFSYPIGGFNAHVRKIVVDAGYHCAVATVPGKRYPNDDIFALKRTKITDNAGNMFIFWVQASGYYTFFKDRLSGKRGTGYGE